MLRDGDIVTATPKVMSVLLVLVKAAGQPVAKDDLIQAVWPDSFVEDGNLIQNISVLRKLMAQDYPDGSAVETIARFGYRFRPEVHVLHGPVWDKQESERKKEGLASEACVSEDPPPGPDEEKGADFADGFFS